MDHETVSVEGYVLGYLGGGPQGKSEVSLLFNHYTAECWC